LRAYTATTAQMLSSSSLIFALRRSVDCLTGTQEVPLTRGRGAAASELAALAGCVHSGRLAAGLYVLPRAICGALHVAPVTGQDLECSRSPASDNCGGTAGLEAHVNLPSRRYEHVCRMGPQVTRLHFRVVGCAMIASRHPDLRYVYGRGNVTVRRMGGKDLVRASKY
jgi:hypothetical protein